MSFDFPFKKGSGIPLLTASLSPQCLSLLHAMVAYDPDERITAHQALQHPYFREQRWVLRRLGRAGQRGPKELSPSDLPFSEISRVLPCYDGGGGVHAPGRAG